MSLLVGGISDYFYTLKEVFHGCYSFFFFSSRVVSGIHCMAVIFLFFWSQIVWLAVIWGENQNNF